MIALSIPFQKDITIPESYSGWKEYRLDFNSNPESFNEKLIDEQTIITIRDPQEGGVKPFPIHKKIELYIKYIKGTNCLVDLELKNRQFTDNIPPENLILSWHFFTDDWKPEQVKQKIDQAIYYKPRFVKIALNISSYSHFVQLSEILKSYDYPIIFVGMGLLGKQSRILYHHLNSQGTYIGLENKPTASGQLSLQEAELYNLSEHNSETKIGGLIGGEQVYNSLGLKFYNEYFERNNLNAVYLPFPVHNLNNFLNWQKTLENKNYGYSITMPFKQAMSKAVRGEESNINLYLPGKDISYNTDKLALKKALANLRIIKNDKILIYGSGATAEMALQILKAYPNIYLQSRNSAAEKNLQNRYTGLKQASKNNYDLIINCTPIGMKGEDFLEITGLNPATKYIDLPYSTNQTPLIKFCLANNLKFVDGEIFWQWQVEKQLEEFSQALKQ